jgi:hypothetical protein
MAQDSIVQEDKMELKDMSWKEVVEFYGDAIINNYPEALWSDPAEMELEGDTPTLDK